MTNNTQKWLKLWLNSRRAITQQRIEAITMLSHEKPAEIILQFGKLLAWDELSREFIER